LAATALLIPLLALPRFALSSDWTWKCYEVTVLGLDALAAPRLRSFVHRLQVQESSSSGAVARSALSLPLAARLPHLETVYIDRSATEALLRALCASGSATVLNLTVAYSEASAEAVSCSVHTGSAACRGDACTAAPPRFCQRNDRVRL
jgi:hypothetical protein